MPQTIKEMESITVQLEDGREFEVEFWPFDSKTLAITISGEDTEGAGCVVDIGVNLDEDRVIGPDLKKEQ